MQPEQTEREMPELKPPQNEELTDRQLVVEWLGEQVSAAETRLERVRRQTHIDRQIRDASSPAGLDWSGLLNLPAVAIEQSVLGALRGAQWLCSKLQTEHFDG